MRSFLSALRVIFGTLVGGTSEGCQALDNDDDIDNDNGNSVVIGDCNCCQTHKHVLVCPVVRERSSLSRVPIEFETSSKLFALV